MTQPRTPKAFASRSVRGRPSGDCSSELRITALPSTFKGEAKIPSARIRGVLAPVVTPLKLVRFPRSLAPTRVALP